jgi:DDE superfamily endonuclease
MKPEAETEFLQPFLKRAKAGDNLRLLKLPPYSPGLNPAEHVWDDLRETYFHNRVFESVDALEIHLDGAGGPTAPQPTEERVRSTHCSNIW